MRIKNIPDMLWLAPVIERVSHFILNEKSHDMDNELKSKSFVSRFCLRTDLSKLSENRAIRARYYSLLFIPHSIDIFTRL